VNTSARTTRVRTLIRGWRLLQVGVGLVGIAAAQMLLPHLLFLPNMTPGDQVGTPVAAICAWVAAMLALLTANEPVPELFLTSPSFPRRANLVRISAVLGAGTVISATSGATHPAVPVTAGLAFAGEALLFAKFGGLRNAWLPPTVHLLASITVGNVNRVEGLATWAWVLQASPDSLSVVASSVIFLAGLVAWHSVIDPPTTWRTPGRGRG
jgi:hypothetical protein